MNIELMTKTDFDDFKKDISDMITALSKKDTSKIWLRSNEVRELLKISAGTLQKMRLNGDIPYTKLGRTLFYDMYDINRILNENKIVN